MQKKYSTRFALFIIFLLASCVSIQSIKNPPPVRLYIFDCGSILAKDISLWSPGIDEGQHRKLAASCYLIQHPQGNLLWDSGLSDKIAQEPGQTIENSKGFLTVNHPFIGQLKKINIAPKDIHYVAFSHFHGDHVGNANAFAGATVFIQQQEYDAAFGLEPNKFGFDPKYYDEIRSGTMKILNGDFDVFGDKTVIIKSAPGHTPGHQVLFVNLPKTGPIVLSGDLYHFTKNRLYKRVPSFNWNKEESLKSMDAIEEFLKQSHAKLWIQHDLEQNQTLRHAPEYYE